MIIELYPQVSEAVAQTLVTTLFGLSDYLVVVECVPQPSTLPESSEPLDLCHMWQACSLNKKVFSTHN